MLRLICIVSLSLCALGAVIPRGLRPMPGSRIIGGVNASIEDFPYQVSLEYYGSHRCGGSIASGKVIVTAAHCVDGISAANLQIRVGSSLLGGGNVYLVSEALAHPKYDYYNIDFDGAFLVLAKNLTLGPTVQPIRLPSSNHSVKTGAPASITGWGTTQEGSGSLPLNLQTVVAPIVDQKACNDAYYSYGGVTDQMICAGVEEGGKDACQGDSGGPLVVDNILVGATSWGVGCARPNYPGVYVRISSVVEWIVEKSGLIAPTY